MFMMITDMYTMHIYISSHCGQAIQYLFGESSHRSYDQLHCQVAVEPVSDNDDESTGNGEPEMEDEVRCEENRLAGHVQGGAPTTTAMAWKQAEEMHEGPVEVQLRGRTTTCHEVAEA